MLCNATMFNRSQMGNSTCRDVPPRANMSWGWRKLLQVHSFLRSFIWYPLGNGKTASLWFDRWCPQSPLISLTTVHDVTREGFNMSTKVADLLEMVPGLDQSNDYLGFLC